MKIVKWSELKVVETPHRVDVRKMLDTEHVQVMCITLQPGEALRRHITPVDAFFYGLEGQGIAEVGDQRFELGVNQLLNSPANIPHRLLNESDAPFRVLVVKTPRPTTSTKLL